MALLLNGDSFHPLSQPRRGGIIVTLEAQHTNRKPRRGEIIVTLQVKAPPINSEGNGIVVERRFLPFTQPTPEGWHCCNTGSSTQIQRTPKG